MKQSTTFSIPLLELAAKEKYLKPLALYYLVKAKYQHSIIYNYNPYKLSIQTGLHHKTINQYVSKLQKEELVILRDEHLLFISSKKKIKGTLRTLPTRPYTSFEGILNRIYYLILLNNKAEQKYNIAKRYGINIGELKPKTRRKALKQANLEKVSLESIVKPIITVRSASILFNTSLCTTVKILNNLESKNYLQFNPFIKYVGKIKKDSKYLPDNYFNKEDRLYIYLGREIKKGSYLYSML